MKYQQYTKNTCFFSIYIERDFSELGKIDYSDTAVKYATFFIVLMMPLTYSITNGLMIGTFVYVAVSLI